MTHRLPEPDPRPDASCASAPGFVAQGAGLPGQALLDLLAPPPQAESAAAGGQRVAAGATLLHEGSSATQVCVVQAGTFKSVKTAEDGYDHVLGFAMRGDVLGFDGLAAGRYACAAVALEDSRVLPLPLPLLDALRRRDAAFDHALQAALSRQLAHAIELAELMSAVAAEARLARFVLHLSARMAEQGLSPRRLRLRMNRRDIAAHLGLAHETISRCLRLLGEHGLLRVHLREIEILDLEGLRAHAHSTRGAGDDALRSVPPPTRARLPLPAPGPARGRWAVER